MDHPVERPPGAFGLLEGRRDRRGVGEVGAAEAPVAAGAVELGEPGRLEGRVVIVVEVVEAGHPVAAGEEAPGDEEADEAGGAGDEDPQAQAAEEAGAAAEAFGSPSPRPMP